MFCPLIKRLQYAFLFLCAMLLTSAAHAETAPERMQPLLAVQNVAPMTVIPAAIPQARAVPEVVPQEQAAAIAEPEEMEPATLRNVQIVEVPERLSFERMRRENYRFPDSSMATRFVELSTELPPLFGAEE